MSVPEAHFTGFGVCSRDASGLKLDFLVGDLKTLNFVGKHNALKQQGELQPNNGQAIKSFIHSFTHSLLYFRWAGRDF